MKVWAAEQNKEGYQTPSLEEVFGNDANDIRDAFMKETPEEVSRIYTRDKNNSSMKLCKMKSGNFSILNRNTDEVLFTCSDLHEAKVEFIVMQSITDGGMGSKIFEKAMNL